jgi:hypothetical protein
MRNRAIAPLILSALLFAGSQSASSQAAALLSQRDSANALALASSDSAIAARAHGASAVPDVAVWPNLPYFIKGERLFVAEHGKHEGFISARVVGDAAPKAEVGVWSNHRVYDAGDDATVFVETGHVGGYVVVFQIDADGYGRVIYPATPSEDNYVRADQVFAISGPTANGSFSPSPMTGTGLLFAVTSRDHLELAHFAEDGAWKAGAIHLEAGPEAATTGDWGAAYGELLDVARQTTDQIFSSHIVAYTVVDQQATHVQLFVPVLSTDRLIVTTSSAQNALAAEVSGEVGARDCQRYTTWRANDCCPAFDWHACDLSWINTEAPGTPPAPSECYHPRADGTCGKIDQPPNARITLAPGQVPSSVVAHWQPPATGTFASTSKHQPGPPERTPGSTSSAGSDAFHPGSAGFAPHSVGGTGGSAGMHDKPGDPQYGNSRDPDANSRRSPSPSDGQGSGGGSSSRPNVLSSGEMTTGAPSSGGGAPEHQSGGGGGGSPGATSVPMGAGGGQPLGSPNAPVRPPR